jgi:uncharacterized repeat protein (TIGR01451 family)/MYXO-CTERM domain-containing protein
VVTPPGSGANCAAGSSDPDCTVSVPVKSFHVKKTADTTQILPGNTVTYTIVVTNTGAVDYTAQNPASFTDDLSAVLDDAGYNADAAATAGTLGYANSVLSWSGALNVGATVTITYTVTVKDPNPGDRDLRNTVVTPPASGGNCPAAGTDPQCTANIPGPALTLVKTVSSPTVFAGGKVIYTVTATNTGSVPFTASKPATFTDDLSKVLDDATYDNNATSGATISGTVLTWSGPLALGASVTVTYSVTVKANDVGDKILDNTVATGTGIDSNCSSGSTDPNCATRTLVQSFTTVKVMTSAGSLAAGSSVTYSIVVTNTGQVDYTPTAQAKFTDDFSKVVDDATYNHDAASTAGTVVYGAPILTWSGPLAVGASATVTYSFVVKKSGGDGQLHNSVVSANGMGGNCLAGATSSECEVTTAVFHDPLAFTGEDALPGVITIVVLLGAGGLFLAVSRRRRRRA